MARCVDEYNLTMGRRCLKLHRSVTKWFTEQDMGTPLGDSLGNGSKSQDRRGVSPPKDTSCERRGRQSSGEINGKARTVNAGDWVESKVTWRNREAEMSDPDFVRNPSYGYRGSQQASGVGSSAGYGAYVAPHAGVVPHGASMGYVAYIDPHNMPPNYYHAAPAPVHFVDYSR